MISRPARFFLLTRALLRTSGTSAVQQAIPTFAGLAIVASILFSPVGLEARTVTAFAARSPLARAALWVGWLVLVAPLVRALLGARSASFLRALPVPRGWIVGVLAAMTLTLQAPWAMLWGKGAGPTAGTSAALCAAAIAAFVATRPLRAPDLGIVAATVGAAFFAPPAAAAIVGSVALARGVFVAWVRGRDEAHSHTPRVRGPATIALGIAYALRVPRSEAAILLRGALLAIAAGGLGALGAHNNGIDGAAEWTSFVLAIAILPLVVATAGAAGAVRRADEALHRIVLATGARPRVAIAARTFAAGVWGAFFGIAATATSIAVGAPPGATFSALGSGALLGAALGVLAVDLGGRCAAWAARRRRDPGGATIAALVVVAGIAFAANALLGSRGTLALCLAAAATVCARRPRALRSAPMQETTHATALLEANALRKAFGGRVVLDDVTFSWSGPGNVVVSGENGAGKSTLLGMLAGVVEPDAGVVVLGGDRLDRERERALARVGWVPDAIDLPEHLSVAELVRLVASLKGVALPPDDLAERLGVRALFGERLRALSLGQRRRAGLLAALAGDPPLLVLDEPTNGLDVDGVAMLRGLLQERAARGASAVIATHDAAFAEGVAAATLALESGKGTLR